MNAHSDGTRADAALAVTGTLWIASHMAEVNLFLQFFVLVCALISGLFSLYWHIDKWFEKRK